MTEKHHLTLENKENRKHTGDWKLTQTFTQLFIANLITLAIITGT